MEAKKKSPPHTFPHTFFAIKTSTSAPQQLLATVLSSKTSLRSHTICQIHMVHFVPCLFFLVFSSAGAEFVANKAWGDNATHEARGQVKGMTQSVLSVCDKLPAPLLRGGQSKKKKRGRGWLTSPDSQEDTRVVSKRGKSSGCSRLRRASSAPAQTLSQWTRELLGPIMDSMMWRSWILLALLFLFIYLFREVKLLLLKRCSLHMRGGSATAETQHSQMSTANLKIKKKGAHWVKATFVERSL